MTDTTDSHAVRPGQLRKFTGELGLSFYHGRMFLVIPRDQQNESDSENYSIFIAIILSIILIPIYDHLLFCIISHLLQVEIQILKSFLLFLIFCCIKRYDVVNIILIFDPHQSYSMFIR